MNPNQLIARAKGTGTGNNADEHTLAQYVVWSVNERPDSMVIIANTRETTPTMSRWKILRGDRNAAKGWCVLEADELPGATVIMRKEFLRAR